MEENRMTTVFDGLSTREKKTLSRRDILKRGAGLSLGAMLVISGNAVICPQFAWALESTTLKPETMATLIPAMRATSTRMTSCPTVSTPSPSSPMTRIPPRTRRSRS
jgi:hypothetical protein